ncbi:MAG: transposase, partial [Chloroflexia bacterium]
MGKSISMRAFMQALFDDETEAEQAAEIGEAILAARSLGLTEIAAKMRGSLAAAYKRIQRFLRRVDPREVLWRLFREEARFVLADVTEIERPQARKSGYVGTLEDGKTKGFWLLVLATPYRGRAIPFGF